MSSSQLGTGSMSGWPQSRCRGPHFQSLLLDGGYVEGAHGLEFHALGPPTQHDVQGLVETIAHRVIRMLERGGIMSATEFGADPFAEQPALGALVGDSIGGRGHSRLRESAEDEQPVPPQCAPSRGFSLHAATPERSVGCRRASPTQFPVLTPT